MPINLPAFCDNEGCGAIFPSGFVFESAINTSLSGNKSGPCPRCGSMGHIPDGIYNFIEDTIEVLAAPSRTIDDLRQLSEFVNRIKNEKSSPDSIKNEIQKNFPWLAKVIPATKQELYSFIGIIIPIIVAFFPVQKQSAETTLNQNITVNQVIEKAYFECNSKDAKIEAKEERIGRNDPCPCGKNNPNAGRPFKY